MINQSKNTQVLQNTKQNLHYYPLQNLASTTQLKKLPYSIRILLEASYRNQDGFAILPEDINSLLNWKSASKQEIAFCPGRVILQDFTGVPAIVDLAALRNAMLEHKKDPKKINPQVPVDLVIDHSIQVDFSSSPEALSKNMAKEFERNKERYQFLKWGENAFGNLRIIPPGMGIVHQINLEFLAQVALKKQSLDQCLVYPDSLVGTDSHTTMINALGVLGWGVGGIEAEAVMLGQPIYMLIPEVIGIHLTGECPKESTATDIVLRITQLLREYGVVSKFVEFFGSGIQSLSLPDRATISNMAPEYGATCAYFPVDEQNLLYLHETGRKSEDIHLVEQYFKQQDLFHSNSSQTPDYTDIVEVDLSTIEPSISGPRRPQDRISLSHAKKSWQNNLHKDIKEGGFGLSNEQTKLEVNVLATGETLSYENVSEDSYNLANGSILIAAITSCTNTSNPELMICAGLLAKKAVEKGLTIPPYVKTSLAPGSRVVSDYLKAASLDTYLEKLGFHTVGYGCTTCIGNSGPLAPEIVDAVQKNNLVAVSVLSGNRNFEGRISPHVKANFLMSPPLVIAYALAGHIDIDLTKEPITQNAKNKERQEVYLKNIWPDKSEIQEVLAKNLSAHLYKNRYHKLQNKENQQKDTKEKIEDSNNKHQELWDQFQAPKKDIYPWDKSSTYVRQPNFFQKLPIQLIPLKDIENARCLVKVGDSITTDHISPAGAIPRGMPAANYLMKHGVEAKNFNSFGSRRGNDQVMTRGTFGNIRLRNQLAKDREGSWTTHQPSKEVMTIYDASLRYQQENTPLIVLAGKEYGTGSSRDWAAKGTYTLGCRAVIATSFERIHRSNLVGMGVLPLQFTNGKTHKNLDLTGSELYTIKGLGDDLKPQSTLILLADNKKIPVICRLDTPVEVEYYKNGGILHTVLRKFLNS